MGALPLQSACHTVLLLATVPLDPLHWKLKRARPYAGEALARASHQRSRASVGVQVITVGSIPRSEIAELFPFLAERFGGRRNAIKELTHGRPDFVFWIFPDGRLFDARDAHARNVPKGHENILDDEPDYGGFIRGRVVTSRGRQLIVVYCLPEALAVPGPKLRQFLRGIRDVPVPVSDDAVVISDNADLYGTLTDLEDRERQAR